MHGEPEPKRIYFARQEWLHYLGNYLGSLGMSGRKWILNFKPLVLTEINFKF